MNIKKVAGNITIRPTDRKMKQAKHLVESTGVLPKEMPIEKKFYIVPASQMLNRIKDSIDTAVDNFMRKG